jgi:hypothetical protein
LIDLAAYILGIGMKMSQLGQASSGSPPAPPEYLYPALEFNDTGSPDGGDRNSMYLPIV